MDYNNPNAPWFNTGYDPYKGLNDEERLKAGCFQMVAFIVMLIVGLLLCAMLSGCTTTKYVTVPEYHTDTLIVTQHQRDSIHVHDSIHVTERGDTVRIETWHTKYVECEVHDTLYQSKTDSIPYPVPVIQEVPAQLTWWQQARMHVGGIVIYGILIILIIYIFKLYRKYAKP